MVFSHRLLWGLNPSQLFLFDVSARAVNYCPMKSTRKEDARAQACTPQKAHAMPLAFLGIYYLLKLLV